MSDSINFRAKEPPAQDAEALSRRLQGMPEHNDTSENDPDQPAIIELAYFQPAAGGKPDFSRAAEYDAEVKKDWEDLKTDPGSEGFFDNLIIDMRKAAKERLSALGKPSSNDGIAIARLKADLQTLRVLEEDHKANNYLTDEMRLYLRAFSVVGTCRTLQLESSDIAELELRRLAGRTPSNGTNERDDMQKEIYRHLTTFFPIERPWAQWTDEQKRIAITQLQLRTSDKSKGMDELEWYHNRFLASAIFTETTELGRPFGVETNRNRLNRFVLENVAKDLIIPESAGRGWNAKTRRDFIKKYNVTGEEADQMHERVRLMYEGKV